MNNRPRAVRYKLAGEGQRVAWAWFHEPDKVALGGLLSGTNLTLFLLVGAVRICWFVPDEEPHLRPAKETGPVRGVRNGKTEKESGRDTGAAVSPMPAR